MLFNLHVFECLGFFSLRFVSSFSPLWSEKMLIWFQFSWICWGLFCVLSCGLSLKMVHVHLKRMCILLLWDERLYIYQLSPFLLRPCSMLKDLCWYFVWKISPLLTVGCQNPLVSMLLSISFLKASQIFLMCLHAHLLDAYIFIMFMSSC